MATTKKNAKNKTTTNATNSRMAKGAIPGGGKTPKPVSRPAGGTKTGGGGSAGSRRGG